MVRVLQLRRTLAVTHRRAGGPGGAAARGNVVLRVQVGRIFRLLWFEIPRLNVAQLGAQILHRFRFDACGARFQIRIPFAKNKNKIETCFKLLMKFN